MSKKSRLRNFFNSQYAEGSQTMLKSAQQHFYHFFLSLSREWIWKMSLLVISEILELFLNTLTADDKYSLRKSENFWQPIQMKLSKKETFFS